MTFASLSVRPSVGTANSWFYGNWRKRRIGICGRSASLPPSFPQRTERRRMHFCSRRCARPETRGNAIKVRANPHSRSALNKRRRATLQWENVKLRRRLTHQQRAVQSLIRSSDDG